MLLDISWLTRGSWARTARYTGLGSVAANGVFRVEPQAIGLLIVPNGHNKDHTLALGKGLTHLLETTQLVEDVAIAEGSLLLLAEVLRNGISGVDTGDFGEGVGDDLAVLNVEAVDRGKVAGGSLGVCFKLGNHGEFGFGVDGKASTVEASVAHAVGVEVTASLVAGRGAVAAGSACGLLTNGARMRSIRSRVAVRLPDVHLRAASSHATRSRIRIGGGGSPACNVGLPSGLAYGIPANSRDVIGDLTMPLMNLMS